MTYAICHLKIMAITQHYFEKCNVLQHITITFFNYPMPVLDCCIRPQTIVGVCCIGAGPEFCDGGNLLWSDDGTALLRLNMMKLWRQPKLNCHVTWILTFKQGFTAQKFEMRCEKNPLFCLKFSSKNFYFTKNSLLKNFYFQNRLLGAWHWNSWKVVNVLAKNKMVIRVVLMSTLRFMSRRGQGYCLTFVPGLSWYDNFKHLLKSHRANCKQIPFRATWGWWNENMFKPYSSQDQYSLHTHIW